MNLQAVYVANGVGVFILLMLLWISRTRMLRHHIEDRLFSFMILGVMLGCAVEAFSYAIDGQAFPGARALNYTANTCLYTVNLLLPFSVLVYVELGLYGDRSRIWKKYKPQIFIGLGMFVVNIVNFFVPISFYITEQNVYERRPFGYVYYFIILYYCITAILLTRRYEKEKGALPFFSIQMFLLPILIGAALQFLFYGLSLAWLSASIGLVGLYMMQQNETAYLDPLVDTYNRQYLNQLLSAWITRGRKFAGVMLDIDRFKLINDNYGHSEGDRALQKVAGILKQSRRENEWVFRFAGDEFIVLKMTDDPNGLASYMETVKENVEEENKSGRPYQLSLSYGQSYFGTGDIDTFMKEMDERMYAMKAEHHRPGIQKKEQGDLTGRRQERQRHS